MVSIPLHVFMIAGGLALVLGLEQFGPLVELPVWAALPLLALVPLARLLERRRAYFPVGPLWLRLLRALLGGLLLGAPLWVEAGFLFLTDFGARIDGLLAPWPAIPGWIDLGLLPYLLPLLVAHLGASTPASSAAFSLRGLTRPDNVRARLALFAWSCLVLYLAFGSLAGRWPALRILVEESSFASLGFSIVSLVVLFLAVPRVLLALLDTVPPQAYFRRQGERLQEALGLPSVELHEWRTDDEISNAMVLAMPFGPRPILFTDAFLERLVPGEFEAVLAHELGHVRGRHVGFLALWILTLAFGFELLAGNFPALFSGAMGEAWILVFLALLWGLLGFLSRRLELEADLYALEAIGDHRPLVAVLDRSGPLRRFRSGWRHFSVVRRGLFLRAAERDPGVGRRLRVGLGRLRWAGVVLFGLAALGIGLDFLQRAPGEGLRIDLRRGQYGAAAERLAELDTRDLARLGYRAESDVQRLEALVELGAGLERDGADLSVAGLGRLAAEQLEPFDAGQLLALLELALLTAEPGSAPLHGLRPALIVRAYEGHAELEGHGAAASDLSALEADELPAAWRPVLARLRRSG